MVKISFFIVYVDAYKDQFAAWEDKVWSGKNDFLLTEFCIVMSFCIVGDRQGPPPERRVHERNNPRGTLFSHILNDVKVKHIKILFLKKVDHVFIDDAPPWTVGGQGRVTSSWMASVFLAAIVSRMLV